MSEKAPFMVFSGTNSRYLAEKICASLDCPLGNMNITHFADGEFAVSYEESIRGAHVFLVQSTFPNSDNLMELLLMIDAAKRASAKSVVAVVPYFGWARQDRKDKPRVSIGAKLVADLLSVAGIDRLITMDLHADQIQGFFNPGRPSVCISRIPPLHPVVETGRAGDCYTGCRRFKTC
jgi:ribose-phosphate pyrophosphokinase